MPMLKKEAAKAVSKTNHQKHRLIRRTFTWDQIQKMKPDVYAKLEDEIDKAHREGRIV